MASRRAAQMAVVLTAVGALTIACGQKGPPLAPLHLVPAAATEMSVRRVADRARLRFVLPARNENGPGPLELDRVEIYAMTIPAGSAEPSPGDLLAKERRVGEIAVRPVLEEGEVAAPDEKRPEPGTPVTFDEELTAQKLTPVVVVPAPVPAVATPGVATAPAATAPAGTQPAAEPTVRPPATAPAAPPAAAPAVPATPQPGAPGTPGTAPATPGTAPAAGQAPPGTAAAVPAVPKPVTVPYERRLYIARGVTRKGRPGAPSGMLSLPLVPLAPPPKQLRTRQTETAVIVEWDAEPAAIGYNVYRGDELLQPVNPSLLKEPSFEDGSAPLGQEQCYRVRSAASADPASLEGDASPPQCLTPRDQFPPAAPQGLAVVPTAGQISLIWDANTEKDLGGYIVLRGEGPDGALTAITPTPIKETSYRDITVKPGTRYIYAIVAVDTATPPNTSPQSARVEETAR
jgi:hypothetical protein